MLSGPACKQSALCSEFRSLCDLHMVQILAHSLPAARGGLPGRLVAHDDRRPENIQFIARHPSVSVRKQGQRRCCHVHQPQPVWHVEGNERPQVSVSLVSYPSTHAALCMQALPKQFAMSLMQTAQTAYYFIGWICSLLPLISLQSETQGLHVLDMINTQCSGAETVRSCRWKHVLLTRYTFVNTLRRINPLVSDWTLPLPMPNLARKLPSAQVPGQAPQPAAVLQAASGERGG